MELVIGRHYLIKAANNVREEFTYKGLEDGMHRFINIKDTSSGVQLQPSDIEKEVKDIPIDPTKGFKYDGDKERWDLLPWDIIKGIVQVLTYGAKKYADNNWQNVPNGRKRYFAAMMRHLIASEQEGEDTDKESGIDHLFHALCCLVFVAYFKFKEKGENK